LSTYHNNRGHLEKFQFKQDFTITFRRSTKNFMILVYQSTSIYLTVLAPH
jgi:hypothetical protein